MHLATARPPHAVGSDSFRLLAHVRRAAVVLDGPPRGTARADPGPGLCVEPRVDVGDRVDAGGRVGVGEGPAGRRNSLPLRSRGGAIWERLVGTG